MRDTKKVTIGRWGVTGYPETFFVDRQGRLVGERIQGGVDTERNKDAFAEGVALALGNTGKLMWDRRTRLQARPLKHIKN